VRKHARGLAVVTVRTTAGDRKDLYLGPWRSSQAEVEYARVCRVIADNGGRYPTADLTVAEVLVRYFRFAEQYYGKNTSGLAHIKRTIRTVREQFGPTPVGEFGPKSLKAVVDRWVSEGITRRSVNKMLGTVKRMWKWLVGEELLAADCFHRLQAVEGLRLGRTRAPDNPPVKPAVRADVEAALPFMPPAVAAVVRLQMLTGARCGELLVMKPVDVGRAGEVWTFSPVTHKGTWRGKGRSIHFGPAAQGILAPLLLRAGDEYVFSPARGEADRNSERSGVRKTPKWPSHLKRNSEKRVATGRTRPPGDRYTTSTLRRAVERACDAAKVARFTPHRLRHLAALEIREKFGVEHARAALGHTIAAMTERYSRSVDDRFAGEVAAVVG
jgi:integrase